MSAFRFGCKSPGEITFTTVSIREELIVYIAIGLLKGYMEEFTVVRYPHVLLTYQITLCQKQVITKYFVCCMDE